MKTQENMGFLPPLEAMGRSEGVESRFKLTKPNKINGFVHVFYGTTVKISLRKWGLGACCYGAAVP